MFRRLKRYQLVVDVSVAAVFFVVAWPIEAVVANGMFGLDTRPDGLGQGAAAFVIGAFVAAIFAAALALRRLSPALALTIAWVGAFAQIGLGRPPSLSDLVIFAVLYATAAYGSRAVYWWGFASALVGALVITVYLVLTPVLTGAGLSWAQLPLALVTLAAAAFALGLAWTIGALVRSAVRARETREAQRRAEEETAAEQERVRIARDMHDVVAHSLAVVIAQADGARYALAAAGSGAAASAPDDAKRSSEAALAHEALTTIASTARSALADVRLLLGQLRHRQADGPQPTLADLEELYAHVRAAGVQLRVEVDPVPRAEPPAAVQLAVYRILQEALTNALRHGAQGGPVSVRLAWFADRVEFEASNPVRGRARVDPAQTTATDASHQPAATVRGHAEPRGHGLIGMRERAQLVGGRLDVAEESGAFVVRATIPLGAAATTGGYA